jgi:hypothetical protein
MKKLLIILFSVVLIINCNAQEKVADASTNAIKKLKPADRIMVDVFVDLWQGLPSTVSTTKNINRGANVYYMKDLPFGKSNFGFAAGVGISCHNLYSDSYIAREKLLDTATGTYSYGKTSFFEIPKTNGNSEVTYKNNKMTAIYADIPIEFRFRTKNNGFKVGLGFKGGILVTSYTKYNGTEYWNTLITDNKVKVKNYKVPNIEKFRYGATLRIGWRWVTAFAFYQISDLFKKDLGPEMYPISVGITISPL